MTREDFINQFGITPEKCKEIMEIAADIVTGEVQTAIENADFYIDPLSYGWTEDELKERFGEDALEKYDDQDGYPNLYDFKKQNSAEMLFGRLISWHTHYDGHTTAIEACRLMDIGEGWRE